MNYQSIIDRVTGYEHSKFIDLKQSIEECSFNCYEFGKKPKNYGDGVIVGSYYDEKKRLMLCQTPEICHSIVVASTGKGKSQGVLSNEIANLNGKCSAIIIDTKGEHITHFYHYLEGVYGKENIHVLDLSNQGTQPFNTILFTTLQKLISKVLKLTIKT